MSDDQLQPDDTLDDKYDEPGHEDVLDGGYDPPDRPRGSMAWGVTAWEESQEETIEQRIKQEIPDPDSAYGAPDNEGGLDADMVGGDDPDAIPADDDFVGDGGRQVGQGVDPHRPGEVQVEVRLGERGKISRRGDQPLRSSDELSSESSSFIGSSFSIRYAVVSVRPWVSAASSSVPKLAS